MSRNRLLYDPRNMAFAAGYRAALDYARRDLNEMHARHVREMDDLREQFNRAQAEFLALRRAALVREKVEGDLALLQRDRERLTRTTEGEIYWLH
jgi:hypothetical protein